MRSTPAFEPDAYIVRYAAHARPVTSTVRSARMTLQDLLTRHGLVAYLPAFEANHVPLSDLPHLSDGEVLRGELAKALARAGKKDAGLGSAGWCGNPRSLGGCTGKDRTDDALAALTTDTKLTKALAKALPATGE